MVASGFRPLVFQLDSMPEIWPVIILLHQQMGSRFGACDVTHARLSSADPAEFHLFHRGLPNYGGIDLKRPSLQHLI